MSVAPIRRGPIPKYPAQPKRRVNRLPRWPRYRYDHFTGWYRLHEQPPVREFPHDATGTRGDRRNEPEIDAPGRQEGLRIP
jgi:hypothetical protein